MPVCELSSSLLELAGDSLPRGAIQPGGSSTFTVRAAPPHPSNVVAACTRYGSGPIQVLHAAPEGWNRAKPAELFRVTLPAVTRGQELNYRVELRRMGRCIATLPADGSWVTIIGDGSPAERDSARTTGSPRQHEGAPHWDYEMTFFATCTVDLRAEVIGSTPDGYRINFYAERGRLVGPQIDAVEQVGTDWVCVRPDGIAVLEKLATWRNVDGAIIFERSSGITDLGPQGYSRVKAGHWTGAPPVVNTPNWSTSHADWQWLNRLQALGMGRTLADDMRVETDIYLPTVGTRRKNG